jgi:VCBS repeat-containing protein
MGLNTRIDQSAAKSIRPADSFRDSAARSIEEAFGEPLTLLTGARALEPRILLDAAGFATATALVDHDDGEPGQGYDFSWMPNIAPEASPAADEIAFVDGSLADLDTLIAGLPENVTVVILDPQRDGVGQIAQYLTGMRGVEAIHLVSHGNAGNLQLGTAQLNANTIAGEFADELAAIGAALSVNADIMVYGCDFAAGDEGAAAVAALAAATGADVAASDDTTGAAVLGGDWDLEASVGEIGANGIEALDYSGALAATNTGAWTIAGSTATNTTSGITTTVTFTPNSANSAFGSVANATFNTIAAFANGADGDPSLSFAYTWDTSPEAATGIPQPQATTDGGLGTITIAFSQPVTNPIINLDRLGGNGFFDPNTAIFGDENSLSNSALWTLLTPGASLAELAGTSHFDVTATTFQRTPNQTMATSGLSSESGFDFFVSTAAGSVQVIGTFTTLTFQISGVGVEGGGADGIELGFIVDSAPNASNDTFTVAEDTTLTGNLYSNNGFGADADPQGDAITVTQINGASFTVGAPITLANGTLTIINATTGAFTFAPNANYVGGQTFTYTIADANGGSDTAMASIVVAADTDRDGILDATDLDDDNDGILDATEGVVALTAANPGNPNIWWDVNAQPFPGAVEQNNISAFIPSGSGVTFGSGITVTPILDEWNIAGNTATTLADAITSNEYIEFSFTSAATANGFMNSWETFRIPGQPYIGGNVAVMVNGVLVSDTPMPAPRTNFVETQFNIVPQVEIHPSTTYTMRFYIYGGTAGVLDALGMNFSAARDTDSDQVFDHLDLDSDNDGISDLSESVAGVGDALADINLDGAVSLVESVSAGATGDGDIDNDGLMDIFDANTASITAAASLGNTPINTDGDTRQDYLDLDSDGDGIADTVEVRLTVGYVANDGDVRNDDSDGDGVIDLFDTGSGFGGIFSAPVNTDGADTADYIDTNSDNDGLLDSAESGLSAVATDANGDGIRDSVGASYADPDGLVNDPQTALANEFGTTAEVGFREIRDTDGDGVADIIDIDDDNDGILDAVEANTSGLAGEFNGTFGTLSPGNNTRNLQSPVGGGGYTYAVSPSNEPPPTNDGAGEYAVVNRQGSIDFHATGGFFDSFGHTTGTADDAFLAVNGSTAVGIFTAETVQVLPNTSYEFGFWLKNGGNNPTGFPVNVGMRVIDPATNTVLATVSSGSTAAANWTEVQGAINTASATSLRFELFNISTGSVGNDFMIDDIFLRQQGEAFAPRDTDQDGIADHLDIDSDDDGITDNIEAQTTDGYIAPSGTGAAMLDANNDGLDDNYGPGGLTPVNTDGADLADWRDLDSDNDAMTDNAENGLGVAIVAPGATDSDGDGLKDVYETAIDGNANDGFVVNEGVSDPLLAEANNNGYLPDDGDAVAGSVVPMTADLNYRDATPDASLAIDLDGDDSSGAGGGGYADLFVENGAGQLIVDSDFTLVSAAGVATVGITVSGIQDSGREIVALLGTDIPLDADSSGTLAAVSGNIGYAFDATAGVLTLSRSGGGAMTADDVVALLGNASFRVTGDEPAPGARNFTIALTDGTNTLNASVVSTIMVTEVNDQPAAAIGVPATGIGPQDLVVIDMSVPNAADIVARLPAGTEYLTIAAGSDGVAMLASYLATRSGIETIHVVSHGDAGGFSLGTAYLTGTSIGGAYAAQLAQFGAALTPGGDILVYGCNFGQNLAAMTALASATGADIAASNDNTGASSLGGDWVLETAVGAIEAPAIDVGGWNGLLVLQNTGAWTIPTATATQASPVTVINATAGVVTSITFQPEGASTSFSSITNGTINTIAAFANGADGDPSLSFIYNWDTSPGGSTGEASTDAQTGLITITFSQPVTNPILNLDRIGGQAGAVHNGMMLTLLSGGVSLSKISGPAHFLVNSAAGTITRAGIDTVVGGGYSAESSLNGATGTAPGSVQLIGTFTTVQFRASIAPGSNEGSGGDGVELGLTLSVNTPPAASSPNYATPEDTPIVLGGVSFADAEGATGNVTVTLSVDSGTLDIDDTVAGGVTAGQISGDGTGAIVITAPLSAINATLAAAAGLTFTPAADMNGIVNFTAAIDDLGNGDSGVTPLSDTANATITVAPVNDPPVGVPDTIPITEDTPVTQNVLGNDTDADNDTLTISSASIDTDGDGNPDPLTLGAPTPIVDNLGNPVGTITVSGNGDVIFAPAPDYTGPVPNLTYVPNDGAADGSPATVAFGPITPVNDPPALDLDNDNSSNSTGAGTGANFEYTYVENAAAAPIVDVTGFTLTDIDNQIVELVVTLTDGQIGDTLQFPSVMPGGITASVVPAATLVAPGPMTLTLTGTGATTLADWQAVLAAITFLPSTNDVHNPDPADRHITVQASDASSGNSNLATATIHVVPENDPPTLDLDDFNTTGLNAGNYQGTYVENAAGAPISDGVVITDLDDTNLESMTVTLTNGAMGDLLTIGALPPGISLVGAPPSALAAPGTITVQLTGSATLADYQAAIAAIAFSSASENPAAGVRSIEVTGNDGASDTATRTAFITLQPVNDAPFPIDPAGDPNTPADAMPPQTGSDAQALAPFDASSYFNDFDNPVANLTYSLDPSAPAWLSIDTNTGIVSGTPPSDASQNTNTGTPGSYDIIVIATDPGGLSGQTTVSYTIANPPPVAVGDAFLAFESGGASGNVLSANPTTADSDPDGDTLSVSAVNGAPANVGVPTAGSAGGLFFIAATGGFTFSANGDFEDLAVGETRDTTITYTIDDGQGGTDTAAVTVTVVGANDAPVIVGTIPAQTGNDAQAIVNLDIASAFDDPDTNDVLTYTAAGLPAGLVISPAGVISGTIDPSASQNGNTGLPTDGVYTVVVTADDGNGGTVDLTFTYTVSNPPPVAQNDVFSGDEDTPATGLDVFADNGGGADADPDGDTPLAVSEVNGSPANVGTPTAGDNGGMFTLNANGTLNFDPNGDFEYLAVGESATTVITYRLSDGEGGFSTATVTYTVNGVNDNPVPVIPGDPNPPADPNDYIPVQSGVDSQPVTPLDLTQYFADPDLSDVLTIAINPGELPPGLTFDGTTISGTLDPNASQGGDDPFGNPGVYLIPVTVTDGNGGSFTTTLTYDISNPPPVAVDDALTGDEDTPATGDLFAANPANPDADPDGDAFIVTRVFGSGGEGDLAALADGAGVGVAVAGSAGGAFTVSATGAVSFDPGVDFQDLDVGETRVTQIVYQIDDGDGGTDTAVVSFTVAGANDGPVVIDPNDPFPNPNDPPVPGDPDNVIPDQTGNDGQTLTPLDVSPYFVDVDIEALTFSLGVGAPPWLAIDPLTGVISGTPPADASQGGPNSDGIYPVTVVATDPEGAMATTTVDFAIANLPPIAVDDASGGDEDHDQSGNVLTDAVTGDADTPPDADPLTVTDVNGNPVAPGSPAVLALTYGTLTLNSDGSWLFAPSAAANQLPDTAIVTETVSYTIDDGNGGTDTADLVITVNGVNDPVQVVDPNDPATDPTDPSYDPVNPAVIPDPDNLIPDVAYDDGETIAPIPAGDYFGDAESDAISFAASDLPPGLSIDPATGEISGALDRAASQGGNTPNPGEYLVTITATDPQGNTASTTVTITASNLPPIAEDDALTADEDTVIAGSVMADNGGGTDGDTAPDTDLILVSEVNGNPANVGIPVAGIGGGTFTILADGTYQFDPGTDFQDLDVGETRVTTVAYTISDGNGGADTATVTVTVTGVNDGPVVIDPNDPFPNPNDPPVPGDPDNVIPDQSGNDGQALTPLDVSPYFVDVDVEALTFSLGVGAPSWLSIDPSTGEITGTPPVDASQGGPNSDGIYPVTVVATDPDGEMATTTVDFSIANLPPLAQNDAVSAPEDGVSAGDVFADNGNGVDADTAPDADPIVVSAVNGLPANVNAPVAGSNGGSFTISDTGVFAFDPGTDFQDLDAGETRETTVAYTISDGNGGTSFATVTMTVIGANDSPVVIDPNDPFPDPNDPPVPGDPDNVIADVAGQDSVPVVPVDVTPYFHDVDGETLTYSFGPGAPTWLAIDPLTGIVSGTPPSDASQGGPGSDGVYPVTIVATDPDGETASTTLDFAIVNIPPVGDPAIPPQVETAGYDFELPTAGHFDDPDNDTLTYSATGLPGGLAIDPATGEIAGVVSPSAVGDAPLGDGLYTVTVTVDDGQGGTASLTFPFRILSLPFASDKPPEPPSDTDPPTPPEEAIPAINLIVDTAVQEISPLGPLTGLLTRYPVTEAVNGITPLGAGMNFDVSNHPVTQIVEWIERTRAALAGEYGLGDDGEFGPWFGGDARIADPDGDIIVRTLVWDGVVYVEFLPESGGWRLAIDGDDRLPGGAERIAANLLAYRPPAGDDRFELTLMRNGESHRFVVDTIGGVIENLPDRLGALNAAPNLPAPTIELR